VVSLVTNAFTAVRRPHIALGEFAWI